MKKGFSLIEIIIVISIMSILSLASFFSISNYKRLSSEVDTLMSENMVLALINDGKQYCRENENSGYILFDVSRNDINFYSSGRRVDGFKLPKGVSIHSINTQYNRVDIDQDGFAKDAGTIILKDRTGELHNITISVGTGYAEIK